MHEDNIILNNFSVLLEMRIAGDMLPPIGEREQRTDLRGP